MAATERIPVWKRLGLQLKRDGQSGDPVDNLNGAHNLQSGPTDSAGQPTVTRPAQNTHNITSENRKPSKLGKRKHADEQADSPKSSSKKRKQTETLIETNGNTAGEPSTATAQVNGSEGAAEKTSEEAATRPKPKGDPNYRKKKQKAPRREVQSDHRASFEETIAKDTRHEARDLRAPSPNSGEAGDTLLLSTETEAQSHFVPTPLKKVKISDPFRHSSLKATPDSATPPAPLRRKSVTFTPDTKKVDGNSASVYFKNWVAEQKQSGAEFTSTEIQEFVPPPKVHPANDLPASTSAKTKAERKAEKTARKRERQAKAEESRALEKAPLSKDTKKSQEENQPQDKGSKKDPSIYLSYLSEYHKSRSTWKFNKAKQTDVLKNALNVFKIPEEYSEALIAYIEGLQGAGARDRLTEACKAAIEELDKDTGEDMDDPAARKEAHDAALKERIGREKKRRRTDADIQGLAESDNPVNYVKKLKRRRAEDLLGAISRSSPAAAIVSVTTKPNGMGHKIVFQDELPNNLKLKRRNRKSRTEVSDSSSSESSSDESSSDESSSSSDDSSDDSSSESDSDDSSDDSSESESDSEPIVGRPSAPDSAGNHANDSGSDDSSDSSEDGSDSADSDDSDDSDSSGDSSEESD